MPPLPAVRERASRQFLPSPTHSPAIHLSESWRAWEGDCTPFPGTAPTPHQRSVGCQRKPPQWGFSLLPQPSERGWENPSPAPSSVTSISPSPCRPLMGVGLVMARECISPLPHLSERLACWAAGVGGKPTPCRSLLRVASAGLGDVFCPPCSPHPAQRDWQGGRLRKKKSPPPLQ